MNQLFRQILDFITAHPYETVIACISTFILLKFLLWYMRYTYVSRIKNKYIRIVMPREDSQKDKEKDNEKDFKEKVAIMQQFYRAISEIRELNITNILRSWLFHADIVSFEIVVQDKTIDFYVVTVEPFSRIIEKQITTFYPNAEIQYVEPYDIAPKGTFSKCFFAHTQKDYWFPVKTFKNLENDPLNGLTNIFSKIQENEKAAIQVIVRPKNHKWQKIATKKGEALFQGRPEHKFNIPLLGSIFSLFTDLIFGYQKGQEKGPTDYEHGYVRMLQSKEDVAKGIGEKARDAGFDSVIRLVATSTTEERAQQIMNDINVAFSVFKDGLSNWIEARRIIPIDFINNRIFLKHFKNRVLESRIFGFGEKTSLLADEELASIYHFPTSKYNYTPNIRWLAYKVLPAPSEVPTDGIILGNNVYRGYKSEIRFGKGDRMRHHYILGKSGTGKSSFINFMSRQDIVNGEGIAVIDPHGDLVDDTIPYIPKERAKDVIIFDPSDQERPMGLNILEAGTPEQMDLAATQATEIFIKIFGDEIFGPRIQHYFRNACLTLMEDLEEGATLVDVPRIFVDTEFRKYKVSKVTNPVVMDFWQHEYAETGDRERQEMIPYFSAKFGPFITNTIMRNTIGQTKSAFNFREVMDNGKILLVKLSKGKIGDLNTQLLGLIIVARLQMAAMSRMDTSLEKRKPFFLYVDEFQNFATDSFCSILSEARKYGLGLIMAHQYIGQLTVTKFGSTSTQIRDAVFGNVGTISSFKIGAEDSEYMTKEFAPLLTEQDLIGISNYKAYMKMSINGTTSRPFSMDTIWDESGKNDKIGNIIREYSRMKHGRKRQFVEEEITARIGIDISKNAEQADADLNPEASPSPEAAPEPVQPAVPAPPTTPTT